MGYVAVGLARGDFSEISFPIRTSILDLGSRDLEGPLLNQVRLHPSHLPRLPARTPQSSTNHIEPFKMSGSHSTTPLLAPRLGLSGFPNGSLLWRTGALFGEFVS